MSLFGHGYPYTDFHELNLDWVLKQILQMRDDMTAFIRKETIKIANPITWDIQKQYEANTIVYYQGKAYLSKKPVNGEALNDTDYWLLIYDFTFFTDNMINVKECGAIGDGIHDDTDAIRQALIIGEGHTIYFPEGEYITDGIILPSNTSLVGFNMQKSIIKLKDGSFHHVIDGGRFNHNADGVKKSEPIGCKSAVIQGLTIDGNRENCPEGGGGIMIYGLNNQITQVTVRECKTYGVYLESPGRVYSLDVGINLQNDLTNLTIYNCGKGELVYNGQSDSNIYNVLCYGESDSDEYIHARFGDKANGVRVFGLHVWGNAYIGCLNEAIKSYFYNCHFETARLAQFKTTAPTTFHGHVYLNNVVNDSAGVLIDGSGANTCILDYRASGIKYPFKLGTNGGHHIVNYIAYYNGDDGEVIVGTPNASMQINGTIWGGTNQNFMYNRNTIIDSDTDDHVMNDNINYHIRTRGQSIPSLSVENIGNDVTSFVSIIGGSTTTGPQIMVRGNEENADLRLTPKGDGMVRFGERVSESNVTPDTTIQIKTTDGHVVKLIGKFVR